MKFPNNLLNLDVTVTTVRADDTAYIGKITAITDDYITMNVLDDEYLIPWTAICSILVKSDN